MKVSPKEFLKKHKIAILGDYLSAESGDRLAFWGVILGLGFGLYLASVQKKDSANLNAITKSAEINMLAMQELDACRVAIASSISPVRSTVANIQNAVVSIRACRGRIGVALVGLKALREKFNFDGAVGDYNAVSELDRRLLEVVESIRSANFNDFQIQKGILEEIFDLLSNDKPGVPSINKLQEQLRH